MFILNERLMSQIDFRYWAERYYHIEQDARLGGGIRLLKLWNPQEIAYRVIQERELECFEEYLAGDPSDGILIAWHKARQLGATAFIRALSTHLQTTNQEVRSLAASANEDMVGELYVRDNIAYDKLAWYICPIRTYNVKDYQMSFDTNCRLIYQHSKQEIGLGTGRQFDFVHVTEASLWYNTAVITFSLLPAIPQSYRTRAFIESTANGRDYFWMPFTESVRNGRKIGWRYCFVPYYAEPMKYSRKPPADWVPSEISLAHANKVYETSPEFFFGKHITLPKYTLYWWESTRNYYVDQDDLPKFLTNYCATPEESFQNTGKSGFSSRLVEKWRMAASFETAQAYGVPDGIY